MQATSIEKMRIAQKKDKSKKRHKVEDVHNKGGVKRIDGRSRFTCVKGQRVYIDWHGKFSKH